MKTEDTVTLTLTLPRRVVEMFEVDLPDDPHPEYRANMALFYLLMGTTRGRQMAEAIRKALAEAEGGAS